MTLGPSRPLATKRIAVVLAALTLLVTACGQASATEADEFYGAVRALTPGAYGAQEQACAETSFNGLAVEGPQERGYFACWLVPTEGAAPEVWLEQVAADASRMPPLYGCSEAGAGPARCFAYEPSEWLSPVVFMMEASHGQFDVGFGMADARDGQVQESLGW